MISHTCSFTLSIRFIRCQLLFPVRRLLLVQKSQTESCVVSCWVAPCSSFRSYQPTSLDILWHLSPHVSDLQDVSLLPASFFQSRSLLSSFLAPFSALWDHVFFWEPLFLASSFFQNPSLNNVYSEQPCAINALTCGSDSCLFINWRIWSVPLFFSPSVTKIYKETIPVTAIKQQVFGWDFKGFISDIPPHTYIHPIIYCLLVMTIYVFPSCYTWLSSLHGMLSQLQKSLSNHAVPGHVSWLLTSLPGFH